MIKGWKRRRRRGKGEGRKRMLYEDEKSPPPRWPSIGNVEPVPIRAPVLIHRDGANKWSTNNVATAIIASAKHALL